MPGMDGFELCARIKRFADLPIIVLSAVDADESKVRALEEYAEDYITKPFNPDELVARVQRVLRRVGGGRSSVSIDDGELEIDLASRTVTTAAGTQPLTPIEVRVLQILVGSLDRTVRTETILDRVWSDADGADPSYVWVTVRRLRRKLELDPDRPRYLLTDRGVGYRYGLGRVRGGSAGSPGAMTLPLRLFWFLLLAALPPLIILATFEALGEPLVVRLGQGATLTIVASEARKKATA